MNPELHESPFLNSFFPVGLIKPYLLNARGSLISASLNLLT